MERLVQGTKEIISVNVQDRLGSITDLSSYSGEFKVVTHDEITIKIDWTAVTALVGMRIDCLVDTAGFVKGKFKLFARVTIGSERPVLGPFDFEVI